jgi:hypothetical protein
MEILLKKTNCKKNMKATFYIEDGLDVTPEDLERLPIKATGFRSCKELPIQLRCMSGEELELNVRYQQGKGTVIEPRHTDVTVSYNREMSPGRPLARWESFNSTGLRIRMDSETVYQLVNTLRD